VDHVTYRELTDRRAWLLDVVAAVGPGANNVGARTAAVVLPTVLNELDTRAHAYKAAAGHAYSCTCGFSCIGLAAFDAHMDRYPPESPDSNAHQEMQSLRWTKICHPGENCPARVAATEECPSLCFLSIDKAAA
jgi:hypothetical protein